MRFVFYSIFILMSSILSGQYSISGTIADSMNKGIDQVFVVLDGDRSVLTDADGRYRIENVAAGNYTLEFSRVGYYPFQEDISVTNDITVPTIVLNSNGILNEVLVSSVRVGDQDPFTYSTATKEELEERNMGQDIPMLLDHLPSVISSSDAGAGIGYTYLRVRGSDASRVNVTINGIPYNDAESQQTFWVDIPDMASSAQSIQVQRGVGTSTNGPSAFGASVNILTDAISTEPSASISSSVGSFNTFKNTAKFSTGLLGAGFEFSGRLSDIRSDGYVDRAHSKLKGYDLRANYMSDNRQVKFLAFGGHENTYQAWYGLTSEELAANRRQNPYTYENEVDDYGQQHYQGHWYEQINNLWSTKLSLNYTRGGGYYEQYKSDIDADDFANIVLVKEGQQSDAIVRRWLKNDYYVGTANVQYDGDVNVEGGLFYSHYDGDHFGEVIWSTLFNPEHKIRDHYYDSESIKRESSAYIKSTFDLASRLSAYVDLQGRNVQYETNGMTSDRDPINVDTSYFFFNPKAGLTYAFEDRSVAYLSYARANREPNREDFKNGVTTHEVLDNIELGYRNNDARLSYAINGYMMLYKNQLTLTGEINDVGAPIRETVGSSYRAGIEGQIGFQLTPRLKTNLNASYSLNKNVDYKSNFNGEVKSFGDTDIAFSPSVIAGNVLSWEPFDGFTASLYSKYVGSQYMSNIESPVSKLDDYFINNLGLSYVLNGGDAIKEIRCKLLVNNIGNVKYVDRGYYYSYDDSWSDPNKITTIEGTGYYPQATINVLGGIELRF